MKMICRENRKSLCKNRSNNNIESYLESDTKDAGFRDVSRCRETLDDLNERAGRRIAPRVADSKLILFIVILRQNDDKQRKLTN